MRARGMALSLLFTGRFTFYEPLGWQQLSLRYVKLPAGARVRSLDPEVVERAFRPADLERVSALYDAYTEPLSGPTIRDARYWAGQLRTAGTPGEDFRVAERRGEIVAYVRAAAFGGRVRVLEYARAEHGADALARLLVAFVPAERSLSAPLVRDAALGEALHGQGLVTSPGEDPSAMWRAGPPAPRIAGATPATPTVGCWLVGGPLVTYWVRPLLSLPIAARSPPVRSRDSTDPQRAPSSRPYRGGRGPPGAQRLSAGP
jgi:hypothetical protein